MAASNKKPERAAKADPAKGKAKGKTGSGGGKLVATAGSRVGGSKSGDVLRSSAADAGSGAKVVPAAVPAPPPEKGPPPPLPIPIATFTI